MKPWSSQIELVGGCTRNCEFCGLQSVWNLGDKLSFIPIEMADKIATELGQWLPKLRIEFAMFGEPMLHPEINKIVSIFRTKFPKSQLMITTNTDTIRDNKYELNLDKIKKLFTSGLNILVMDCYDNQYEKYKTQLSNVDFAEVGEYYKGCSCYNYKGWKTKEIILMGDIRENKAVTRKILNHAGNLPDDKCIKFGAKIIKEPLKKNCANPFRELVIKVNGDIVICCMDIKRKAVIGNINDNSIKDIWESQRFNDLREKLYNKERSFEPCNKCDYNGGFRLGLIKYSKEDKLNLDGGKQND